MRFDVIASPDLSGENRVATSNVATGLFQRPHCPLIKTSINSSTSRHLWLSLVFQPIDVVIVFGSQGKIASSIGVNGLQISYNCFQ
jgi:hypothetical protein